MAREKLISFEFNALAGTNKAGTLSPDKNGYYEFAVGAFNSPNAHGFFYEFDKITADLLTNAGSDLQRRLKMGRVRAENEHPDLSNPAWNADQRLARAMFIDGRNTVCLWSEIYPSKETVTDTNGNRVIGVYGLGLPEGEKKQVLIERIANCKSDVCFSGRFFSEDDNPLTGVNRRVRMIINYDLVNDPGIPYACKWTTPRLESQYGFSTPSPTTIVLTPGELLQHSVPSSRVDRAQFESNQSRMEELKQVFHLTATPSASVRVPNSWQF